MKIKGVLPLPTYTKGRGDKKKANLLSLNIKKADKELKWKPKLSLRETLDLTVSWYKFYYQKKNLHELTKMQINYFMNK